MSQRSACPSTRNVRCQVRPMPSAPGAKCVRCTAQPGRFRPAVPCRLAYIDRSRTSSPRGLSRHRALRRVEAERAPAAAARSWRHPPTWAFRASRALSGEALSLGALPPPRLHWARKGWTGEGLGLPDMRQCQQHHARLRDAPAGRAILTHRRRRTSIQGRPHHGPRHGEREQLSSNPSRKLASMRFICLGHAPAAF